MANEKLVNRENLKNVRQAFQDKLENGQIVPSKSLQAQSIQAVSTESGATQETPFIYQGTGTANGTDIVDTSPVGKHLEKQGNSVVVNQLANYENFGTTITDADNCTCTNNNDGTITLVVSSQVSTDGYITLENITKDNGAVSGHQYLISGGKSSLLSVGYGVNSVDTGNNGIATITFSNTITFRVLIKAGLSAGTYKIAPKITDLVKWFGSNSAIPQDLLDHPQNASRYGITNDLSYNTGTLDNSVGRYLECGGRQLWDEEWELGTINNSTGQNEADNTQIRAKNYCRCIPNAYYCFTNLRSGSATRIYWYDKDKNFIESVVTGYGDYETKLSPTNAYYFKIRPAVYNSTTYLHDLCVSLYYATGDGYDKYYAYEQPKVYDTGTETLRSAGSVRDIKQPSGEITRLVGTYTFTGNEVWTWVESSQFWYIDIPSGMSSVKVGGKEICSNGIVAGFTGYNMRVYVSYNAQITSSTNMNTIFSSGTIMFYELATPTTEQGTPFSENIEINDYGTMGWKDTNNAYVSIPQGCKIFYPADYVLFLDSLGQRTDIEWDATKVVSTTDLVGYVKQEDLSSGITDVAGLTYDVKKAFKTGKVVNLQIQASNSTNSAITGTLFKLSSDIRQSSFGNLRLSCIVYTSSAELGLLTLARSTGNCVIDKTLGVGNSLWINVSYIAD